VATMTLTSVQAVDAGGYSVEVTSGAATTTSKVASLTLVTPVVIDTNLFAGEACSKSRPELDTQCDSDRHRGCRRTSGIKA